MSQYYRMPRFSLSAARLHTKLLLTLFLLAVLGGLGVAGLYYAERAGSSARSAAQWLRGNEGDLEAREFLEPKSYRELLALTHDHAFSLPLMVFVLLHLVALTPLPDWSKIALYLCGFGSTAGVLAAPWLVRYAGAEWTWLLVGCGLVLFATMLLSVAVCLFDLWLLGPLVRRCGLGPPAPADPLALGEASRGERAAAPD
ncbi:MAG: hypothetical protein KatS3mg102_1266 [Planctomycetota bacterium]|nr:MAG: hypothetical protein KatS3mg102_1266 [Planctomycetota bacterium]